MKKYAVFLRKSGNISTIVAVKFKKEAKKAAFDKLEKQGFNMKDSDWEIEKIEEVKELI